MALTYEMFEKLEHGKIFASGVASDTPDGLYMARSGRMLSWVAVKGYGNDWAIYCSVFGTPIEEIAQTGDKVFSVQNIKNVISIDDAVLERYRFR